MGSADIKIATQIAQSQYVFGILFVFLFFCTISATIWLFRKLSKENAERETQLKSLNEEQRAESKERERRLMDHLEKTTTTLEKIQQGVESVKEEVRGVKEEVKDVWDEVKFLKRSGQ